MGIEQQLLKSKPREYSLSMDTVTIEVGDEVLVASYGIEQRTKGILRRQSNKANFQISFLNSGVGERFSFDIPKQSKVGDEFTAVENGIYSSLDLAIRGYIQSKSIELTGEGVSKLEEGLISGNGADDALERYISTAINSEQIREVINKALVAARHVTKIPTISREGFQAYLEYRLGIVNKVSLDTQEDIIEGVSNYIEATLHLGADEDKVWQAAREYLGRSGVSHKDSYLEIIHKDFVPQYTQLRHRKKKQDRYPEDILGHVIESTVEGGIAGWIGFGVLEWLANGIFGTSINLPGFYIGTGLVFMAPYVRVTGQKLIGTSKIDRTIASLKDRTSRKLLTYDSSPTVIDIEARAVERTHFSR